MKIAFSTLACPDWTFNEMISTAKDSGFDAIEIRGVENEVYAPKAKQFLEENMSKTLKLLNDKSLKISMLSTSACLGLPQMSDACKQEAYEYIDLAKKLGVPFIRVMISARPYPEDCDFELALENYKIICDYAKDKNVSPLIETNGILADSSKMKEFMQKTQCENAGVLWDIHHPYRYFNESVSQTWDNIGEYVKYTHVKDSVMNDGVVKYKMMGMGDVPVAEAIKLLKENGYDSFITLEWVKRWCPDLEDAGIVFSHFINFMNKQ